MDAKRILSLALLLALAGCTANSGVTADASPSVDFSNFRTFSLVRDASRTEAGARLYEDSIAAALEARGVKRVDRGADMTLAVKFFVSSRTQLNPYSGSATQMQEIQIASINVDLLDAKSSALLWRGSARGDVDPALKPEERRTRARSIAAELFNGFPPAPRK